MIPVRLDKSKLESTKRTKREKKNQIVLSRLWKLWPNLCSFFSIVGTGTKECNNLQWKFFFINVQWWFNLHRIQLFVDENKKKSIFFFRSLSTFYFICTASVFTNRVKSIVTKHRNGSIHISDVATKSMVTIEWILRK